MPLVGYDAAADGDYTCRVKLSVTGAAGAVEVEYSDIPQPDADGVFEIDGMRRVILPTASNSDLDTAEIKCVGEQLCDYIAHRLGEASRDLAWDDSLVRAWLPLKEWIVQFLVESETSQFLEDNNWLHRCEQLRRIRVLDRTSIIAAGQFGRTCPFETPEGINVGRMLHLAVGAEIRDGKIVIVDDRPQAALGVTASMVPFLEHTDSNRLLMGCNMMRQWLVPKEVEPALVRTGNEIDAPDFWCGKNILTAFISWGADTYEDGIVISESAAKRLAAPQTIEVGDKLSNRHGTKGVVSRILPDERMPHLADGTPVELIFSVVGLLSRLNFGQVREAIAGRIAHARGQQMVVPPFVAPKAEDLKKILTDAGLPESGMEILRDGKNGQVLERPSTVGWVYWGCTFHLARGKMHSVAGPSADGSVGQRQTEAEYAAYRDAEAFENIRERFSTCSADSSEAETLADRAAAGPVEQSSSPTPAFDELIRRLSILGIRCVLEGERVDFRLERPPGEVLELTEPVTHPWLRARQISQVGAFEELPEYASLVEANARARRILESGAPDSLRQNALELFEAEVDAFAAALLPPERMQFDNRVLFSGRAIICPGADLAIDQLGLPEEIAWTLFAPMVARELGGTSPVEKRTERATEVLDEAMARSWVIINRAPTFWPASLLAFHPVRMCEKVIRIHPLINRWMNADFDGDQAAVFLPVTDAAQVEAGEKLSVRGHLRRDPELLRWMVPKFAMLWGLAHLCRTVEGRRETAERFGFEPEMPSGLLTGAALEQALKRVRDRDGIDKAVDLMMWVMNRGFAVAKASGASMSPFVNEGLELPPRPTNDDVEAWGAYAEEVRDSLAAFTDYDNEYLGPQVFAVKTGSRGSMQQLTVLVGARGKIRDAHDHIVPCRHGMCEGLTASEALMCTVGARRGIAEIHSRAMQDVYGFAPPRESAGFGVLARARAAARPGMVFAHAAARNETDPLTDLDSRLFVGLSAVRSSMS
jgi:hypothetical protein